MEIKTLLQTIKENPKDATDAVNKLIEQVGNAEDDVVLDNEDADTLVIAANEISSAGILQLIADLARNESNRQLLSREELVANILKCFTTDDPNLTLQAIRSLCNISAENDKAKDLFATANGVKILLSKAENILESSQEDWERLIVPACSCIQNLVMDNENLQEKFLSENALLILWKYLEKFHSKDTKIASVVINGIAQMTENSVGTQKLYECGVLKHLLDTLKTCNEELSMLILTVLLKEYGKEENGRLLLNKCCCVSLLTEIIEKRPCFTQEAIDPLTKEMTDLVVLLTSGEESFNELRSNDQEFLKRFSSWVESDNKHIQVSAGLALGNYARDEQTCGDIVKCKIHENLINRITEHQDDEDYDDRLQAFNSCLRNLCIPVCNKQMLIDAGLSKLAITQVKTRSLPVQFKALAILRLLVQENHLLSTSISLDKELIEKIVELSQTSVVSSIPAESQRLLASVVKYSSADEPIRLLLQYGALDAILPLLSSEHVIMQSEGLIALIIAAANVHDCLKEYEEKECIPKVFNLLKKPEIQAQTCFNGLTFLQAILSLEGGKNLLTSNNVHEVLDKLKDHPEVLIKNKAAETEELLSSV